jgi:phosphohistidine phosphatase
MDLYLIRHADAVPVGEQGITDDFDRPLSAKGQRETQGLAAALSRRGVRLDKMVTSPLLRARQTAEGLIGAWASPTLELCVCEDLAPAGKRRRMARFLRKLGGDSFALVGHQPDLGELAGWLIGSRSARVEMAKAGVAYIACDDQPGKGGGALVWLTTPAWY